MNPLKTFASSYQMAAMISYRTRFEMPLTFKAVGMSRVDYFDFQPEARPTLDTFFMLTESEQIISPELKALGYKAFITRKINDEFVLVQLDRK